MIFSYIAGEFIFIVDQYRAFNASLHNDEALQRFFNLLAKLNNDKPLDHRLIHKIEDYFQYRWSNWKSQPFITEIDQRILNELPDNVEASIYSDFLFKGQIECFKDIFKIPLP